MSTRKNGMTKYGTTPRGIDAMLLYEDLSRARMREAEQDATRLRLVRRLNTAKRWNRVSAWAARRAAHAARSLQG